MDLFLKDQLYVTLRNDWRNWLKKNHDKLNEIWLVYYKKESGKERIPYDDAVEEALCFGWIDSIVKRIDNDKYMQRFTPRKNNSKWSELNKQRAVKMINQGKMTKEGLAKIENAKNNGKWDEIITKPIFEEMPTEFKKALDKNKRAKQYFDSLAPTYKKHYSGWITTAKKSETREQRIKEAIGLLEKNQKLGLK